jgi:hypothetical protein
MDKDLLESGEHISPDIQNEDDARLANDNPSELQTYLELRRQFREDKEARLKAVGLNWTGFQNLERRVVDSIPSEGVVTGKYRAVKEVVETHIIPSTAPLGPNKVRVVLHEERKKHA